MQAMTLIVHRPPPDEVISAYLRERAAELLGERSKPRAYTRAELARALSVSKGWITQFMDGAKAGPKVREGMRVVLAMSGDEIEEAAQRLADDHPEIVRRSRQDDERLPRYDNRELAAESARRSGIDVAAVEEVESMDLKGDDLTPDDWLGLIKAAAARRRLGLRAGRPAGPDMVRATTPQMPKRPGKK